MGILALFPVLALLVAQLSLCQSGGLSRLVLAHRQT
jgi:hypothetical protein